MEERRTYICPLFCGTANEQDHCLILWSVRSLYHTGLLQDFLYPQPRNRKKVLPWRHLLSDITEKLSKPAPIHAGVWNAKNPQKYKSKKEKKVLPWQHLLLCVAMAKCCQLLLLISSNVCRGLECKDPQERFLSKET